MYAELHADSANNGSCMMHERARLGRCPMALSARAESYEKRPGPGSGRNQCLEKRMWPLSRSFLLLVFLVAALTNYCVVVVHPK